MSESRRPRGRGRGSDERTDARPGRPGSEVRRNVSDGSGRFRRGLDHHARQGRLTGPGQASGPSSGHADGRLGRKRRADRAARSGRAAGGMMRPVMAVAGNRDDGARPRGHECDGWGGEGPRDGAPGRPVSRRCRDRRVSARGRSAVMSVMSVVAMRLGARRHRARQPDEQGERHDDPSQHGHPRCGAARHVVGI